MDFNVNANPVLRRQIGAVLISAQIVALVTVLTVRLKGVSFYVHYESHFQFFVRKRK